MNSAQAIRLMQLRAFVPEYARQHIDGTIAGDVEEAAHLELKCHDWQRATLVRVLYALRIAPPAFREVLEGAWTQTHHYRPVLREARTWKQFVRWCRYAAFELPAGLPDMVNIHRGASGIDEEAARRGVSWTLDRERADWFATKWRNANGAAVVVSATVPKSTLMFFSNGREENEVIPDHLPPITAPSG